MGWGRSSSPEHDDSDHVMLLARMVPMVPPRSEMPKEAGARRGLGDQGPEPGPGLLRA